MGLEFGSWFTPLFDHTHTHPHMDTLTHIHYVSVTCLLACVISCLLGTDQIDSVTFGPQSSALDPPPCQCVYPSLYRIARLCLSSVVGVMLFVSFFWSFFIVGPFIFSSCLCLCGLILRLYCRCHLVVISLHCSLPLPSCFIASLARRSFCSCRPVKSVEHAVVVTVRLCHLVDRRNDRRDQIIDAIFKDVILLIWTYDHVWNNVVQVQQISSLTVPRIPYGVCPFVTI
jgi:hypothetical protein